MTHSTVVTLDREVPRIVVVRAFDAPIEGVYRAHVDPELYVQWIGPHGMTTTVDYWDARTGGSWRYVTSGHGFEGAFRGCFHELRPSTLLVGTTTYEGEPDGVSLDRLALEATGPRRTTITCSSLHESFVARDQMVASGMERGMREGYERLDVLLDTKPIDRPTT